MSLSTQPYKGTRDFYPDDMRTRKWMFAKWRKVVESFGYEEYDGPILEPLDLYTAKTSEEIVNDQSFNFEDRGGRKVVMRPEMTPTVSRMVAGKRQELGYPLRLYSIPNCFRYERQQRGRLREFWQLNVDLFGVEGDNAEFEMMILINKLMESFSATEDMYEIRINSRQLLDKRITAAGLKGDSTVPDVTKLVDKIEKIEKAEFDQKLAELVENPNDLLGFFENDGATEDYEDLRQKLEAAGVKNFSFVPTIARGFEYYTDIVFEVFDKNPENTRSLFGGGRYDGLVGEFGVEPVPTVGFGMGDVTFQNFLETHDLLPDLKSDIDVYVVVIGDVLTEAQKVAQHLREKGINVAIDISVRKTDKQIANANKKNIPYKIFVGSEEVSSQVYSIEGQDKKLDLDQIVQLIKGQ
jgi:histidyl-tRNA synthetase